MELVPWEKPLQILHDTATIQSLVVGELTIEEGKAYHEILHTGLGVALDKPADMTKYKDRKLNCRVTVELRKLDMDIVPRKTSVLQSPESVHPQDSEMTQAYSSSDETILYTVSEPKQYNASATHMKKPTARIKQFNINIHGIKRRKLCYRYNSINTKCGKSFTQIIEWNTHH